MQSVVTHERRTQLRSATHDLHVELDALASRLDLTTRVDYSRYLLAIAGPVIGLELALERSGVENVFADWSERRRRFTLALDLHALELTADAIDAPNMSPSAMFGVMYVLEGSRLGAQVLAKRVGASRDECVLAARRYLRDSDATHWKSFLYALEHAHALDADELIAAARFTFNAFRNAFAFYCPPLVASSTRNALTPAFA